MVTISQRTDPAHSEGPGTALIGGGNRRLLFSRLASPDVARAVVLRLRAAIGLGLLADGDRLPKESELAQMLEVTNFTLRAALETLRDEGLIVTRPGKRGGSFVRWQATVDRPSLDDLRTMSATELRDLGDWRQMLMSSSAALAARRASESSWPRLRALAAEVASTSTDSHPGRAYGRFHVELAAAAQSARMSRAEFGMHEEFGWLLSLSLSDAPYRQQASRELTEIATEVASRRPDAARAAAERHSASATEALIKLRLSSLASDARRSAHADGAVDGTTQALADEILRIVGMLTKRLETIVDEAEATVLQGLDEQAVRRRLSTSTMSALVTVDFPVHGMGFIAEPGIEPWREFWMDWWGRGPNGVVADHRHVLDPQRDDFYDYTAREYFAFPRGNGRPWAEGPYIDSGGVDDYVLTFSLPAHHDGRFLGVAAADVLIADIERHLAPWLVASPRQIMIINQEGRVIMSNTATLIVGDVVSVTPGFDMSPIGDFGWRIAAF